MEQFVLKKGRGEQPGASWWTVCYDTVNSCYTAESYFSNGCVGAYYLYEITKEIFDNADTEPGDQTEQQIHSGRLLYEDHSDINAVNYHIIHDNNYETICQWAHIITSDTDVPTWVD
ncbi:MAG: hypothetical protein IKS00_02905 [Bacteroidales bacterium]|nr:hypothetical protein [Bacteroidales bacterium]